MNIYTSRPDAAKLGERMKRDKVVGSTKPIVIEQRRSTCGSGSYELIVDGVFDDTGKLIAAYGTTRNGKMIQKKEFVGKNYRIASADDLEKSN